MSWVLLCKNQTLSIQGANIMQTQFSSKEKDKIYKGIRKKYKQVAKKPDGMFNGA
jgi:hypothetical protein